MPGRECDCTSLHCAVADQQEVHQQPGPVWHYCIRCMVSNVVMSSVHWCICQAAILPVDWLWGLRISSSWAHVCDACPGPSCTWCCLCQIRSHSDLHSKVYRRCESLAQIGTQRVTCGTTAPAAAPLQSPAYSGLEPNVSRCTMVCCTAVLDSTSVCWYK